MASTFANSIAVFKEKTAEALDKKCVDICRELFFDTINLTPVGRPVDRDDHPGLLVAGWNAAVGGFDTINANYPDPDRTETLNRMEIAIPYGTFMKDGYVTLTNSVDYAYRAEYQGWHPPQWLGIRGLDGTGAPYGMVRVSVANIVAKYGY